LSSTLLQEAHGLDSLVTGGSLLNSCINIFIRTLPLYYYLLIILNILSSLSFVLSSFISTPLPSSSIIISPVFSSLLRYLPRQSIVSLVSSSLLRYLPHQSMVSSVFSSFLRYLHLLPTRSSTVSPSASIFQTTILKQFYSSAATSIQIILGAIKVGAVLPTFLPSSVSCNLSNIMSIRAVPFDSSRHPCYLSTTSTWSCLLLLELSLLYERHFIFLYIICHFRVYGLAVVAFYNLV